MPTQFSGYDANDNSHTQITSVPNTGSTQQYQDTVTTSFVGFETPIRSIVAGVRTGTGGSTPVANIKNYNDSNSNPVSVSGALSGDASYERFVVNAEGRIVFNQNTIALSGATEFAWYFYDPRTKQMIGRVGNLPPVSTTAPTVGQLTAPLPSTDVNFDMSYQPTDESYPPPGPSTYTVPPDQGMTFNDVSALMFGDESFGDNIAVANNASAGSDSILPGQVVRIPELSNTDVHNWQGDYRTYNVNAIIGPEYPNMPLPPVKPIHHSFWGELFEAVVGVVGIALDIMSAGALTSVDLALSQLAINLATNMVQQEIGIMSGMQKSFSWGSLGEAGIASVVSSGVNGIIPNGNASSWTAAKDFDKGATTFLEQAGKAEITTLFTQVLDRALRLEKNIDRGQFVTAITDTLVVPNGKVAENAASIPLQMGQDVTDTLVDDGIESLSQHQLLNATMEAANALGTIVGDGLVYGGRDVYNHYRENQSLQPLADSLNTDLKLNAPLANLLAQMNLGVSGLDLTSQDIYGPAQQASPQRNTSVRSNVQGSNPMSQQTLSAAEQAANQAAANTQEQLQQQRVMQNTMAVNTDSDDAFFNQLLSQSSEPTGFLVNHPKINNMIDEAEDTASMFGNLLMSSPAGLELDLAAMGIVKVGMFAKSVITNPLSAAQSIQSTIASGLGRFGLFGMSEVQQTLAEADTLIGNAGHSMVQATQLNVLLAFKDAGILDEDGMLTDYAVSNARPAISKDSVLVNPPVVAALTKEGSDITSWTKLTTPSIELSTGQTLQIHFYQNIDTEEISYDVDFKVKGTVYPTYPWRNTDLEEFMQPKNYSPW